MAIIRPSPALKISLAAYALAAIAAVILILALRMPELGLSFTAAGPQIEARLPGQPAIGLDPHQIVIFQAGNQQLKEPADELVPDFAPSGTSAQIADWYQHRSLLAAMARTGRMTALMGPSLIALAPRHRGLADLSSDVWLLLAQGFIIGLLGVGVLTLRPKDPAARIFAMSCAGVLLAAFSGALFDARELTADGMLLRIAQGVNFVGSNLCGAGITALFLKQPRPLSGSAGPGVLLGVAVLAGLVSAVGWAPLPFFYGGLAVTSALFFIIMIVQWVRSANDPVARSMLRWIGVTVFLGSSILTVAMAAPELLHLPSVAGDGLSILPLLIVYGGVAFGIARFRMFDLDLWAIRLMVGAVAALVLLAVDALLILGLNVAGPTAFSLSVLAVAFLYFPLRRQLWSWLAGRPAISEIDLVQSASDVAFTRDPLDRRAKWRTLLQRLFDPLEIEASEAVVAPVLLESGLVLVVPSAADDGALRLRFRNRGRKLFDQSQIRLAAELVRLMRAAEQTRDEYARGAMEERQRIARDLHDDVSARLLTSLHRDDVGLIRSDLRKVMADIRTMASALSGEHVALDRAIADLRFETGERLEGAGLAMDWPIADFGPESRLLSYESYKNMMSSHREVISNILRHAEASRVSVQISLADGILALRVADDGKGLSLSDGAQGSGLRNIRSRLTQINGCCEIISHAKGTEVAMTIPIAG